MFGKKTRNDEEMEFEAAGHAEPQEGAAPAQPEGEAARLARELEEVSAKYQRLAADFRNYQQRALSNEREARWRGGADVVESVIRSLDFFELALGQDPAKASAEQVISGVRMIRDELLRSLGQHGVTVIAPRVNDEFDPHRHTAVQQIGAVGVGPGRISIVMQPGYALGERVLRPASVAVAPGDVSAAPGPKDEGGCGEGCGCRN